MLSLCGLPGNQSNEIGAHCRRGDDKGFAKQSIPFVCSKLRLRKYSRELLTVLQEHWRAARSAARPITDVVYASELAESPCVPMISNFSVDPHIFRKIGIALVPAGKSDQGVARAGFEFILPRELQGHCLGRNILG